MGTNTVRYANDYADEIETFHPPAVVTAAEAAEARQALVAYDRHLAPAPTARVIGRVTVALAHWYVPDMPHVLAKGLMADWANDLGEFPEWAIEEAFAKWRRANSEKPRIADIRDLCQRAIRKAAHERHRLRAIIRVAEAPAKPQADRAGGVVRSAVRRMPEVSPRDAKPDPKPEKPSAIVHPPSPEQLAEWERAITA